MTIFKFKKFTIFIFIFFLNLTTKLFAAEVDISINDEDFISRTSQFNVPNNVTISLDFPNFKSNIPLESNNKLKSCYETIVNSINNKLDVSKIDITFDENKKIILSAVIHFTSTVTKKFDTPITSTHYFDCSYAE